MVFIDVHAHFQDADQGEDLLSRVDSSEIGGVWLNGTSSKDWSEILRLCDVYDFCRSFCGVHPWYVNDLDSDWDQQLEDLLRQGICGIGEVGLDKTAKAGDWNKQVDVFHCQWELAIQYQKPVIIHCVKALNELEGFIKELDNVPAFLMHSFMGPIDVLERLTERGAYFSISPRSLTENFKKASGLIGAIPVNRLLIETDYPYVPLSYKEFTYEDCLKKTYAQVAKIRAIDLEVLKEKVVENGKIFTH